MAGLTTERLRRMIDEAEADENRQGILDRLEAIENRLEKGSFSDADRDFLMELRRERESGNGDAASGSGEAEGGAGEGSIPDGTTPSTTPDGIAATDKATSGKARTRPGRKSGSAYDWTVDDDGHVVESDIAIVYTGEDEPDEVELPDDDGEA